MSLPKKWVESVGIGKSAAVGVLTQHNGRLVVAPNPDSVLRRKEATVKVSPRTPPRWVGRSIISSYLNGSERITVASRLKLTPVQVSEIKKVERKLVGLETVEESENRMVLQSMLKLQDLDVWKGIARGHVVASLMHKEAIEALISRDASIAENAMRRDDDVDRLYFLGLRQLRQAASNPAIATSLGLSPIDCLDLQSVAKRIEHIADHAENIAMNVRKLIGSSLDQSMVAELAEISRMAHEIHEGAGRALAEGDLALANKVIDQRARMKEVCFKFRNTFHAIDASDGVRINSIVESMERMADYGTDIAEVAINRLAAGCAGAREGSWATAAPKDAG